MGIYLLSSDMLKQVSYNFSTQEQNFHQWLTLKAFSYSAESATLNNLQL